jgi:hypothetical protein
MVAIIVPASFSFMHHLCGRYVSHDVHWRMKIWSCSDGLKISRGHGVALDLQGPQGSEFVALVGCIGHTSLGDVECVAAITGRLGLTRFVGTLTATRSRIVFTADSSRNRELNQFSLCLEEGVLQVSLTLDGVETVSRSMQRSEA